MGYGVIGSPADSGSVSLGSSPGTPANKCTRAPSSSGLGLWLLKPATRVRIPSGLPLISLFSHSKSARREIFVLSTQSYRLAHSSRGGASLRIFSAIQVAPSKLSPADSTMTALGSLAFISRAILVEYDAFRAGPP